MSSQENRTKSEPQNGREIKREEGHIKIRFRSEWYALFFIVSAATVILISIGSFEFLAKFSLQERWSIASVAFVAWWLIFYRFSPRMHVYTLRTFVNEKSLLRPAYQLPDEDKTNILHKISESSESKATSERTSQAIYIAAYKRPFCEIRSNCILFSPK